MLDSLVINECHKNRHFVSKYQKKYGIIILCSNKKTTGDILADISRGGVYVTRTRDPLRDRQVF